MSTNEQIRKSVVKAMQIELMDCGKSAAVLYFDGNPASILAANLAIDAVGKENVFCITATDVGSMNVSRATRAAKDLGVKYMVIPIVLPVASIVSQIEYAGVKLTKESCIKDINLGVVSAVMKAIATQIGGRTMSTVYRYPGYDPLHNLADTELQALYEYYNITLFDN